ncbi:MAG: hypothetical protein ACOCYX_01930, partial [Spirochaetota bacterium]
MRRTLLLLLIISSAVAGWAQPADPFSPQDPVVMGRGGSFTAKATGYNSFFANPAGFAGAGELTLASANVWAFMNRDAVSIARDIAAAHAARDPVARRALIQEAVSIDTTSQEALLLAASLGGLLD